MSEIVFYIRPKEIGRYNIFFIERKLRYINRFYKDRTRKMLNELLSSAKKAKHYEGCYFYFYEG